MKLPDWLTHAFAVETDTSAPPPEQVAAAEKVCHEVVRRKLTPAAVVFLETARPLNYLGAQTMQFFAPMLTVLVEPDSYQAFATFLERRDAIDWLLTKLEELDRGEIEKG